MAVHRLEFSWTSSYRGSNHLHLSSPGKVSKGIRVRGLAEYGFGTLISGTHFFLGQFTSELARYFAKC